jgi:hypothetical protein
MLSLSPIAHFFYTTRCNVLFELHVLRNNYLYLDSVQTYKLERQKPNFSTLGKLFEKSHNENLISIELLLHFYLFILYCSLKIGKRKRKKSSHFPIILFFFF